MIEINQKSLQQKITAFSQIGKTAGGGVTRLTLSAEDITARKMILDFCQEKGLTVKIDDLGNIYATLASDSNRGNKQILAGSHCDSVICGGNYDGILGVIAVMEAIETILNEKLTLNHPLTLVVWTNEEGVRFPPAMMSSGILANKFSETEKLLVTDENGITFGEALEASSFAGERKNRLEPERTEAYLELHIEQGPVLEQEQKSIGVVQGVASMVHYDFTFKGQADHAGTTPMQNRHDALVAAAAFITELQPKLAALDPDLVYTFGEIHVHPNLHTVIPDEVTLSLDARHAVENVITEVRQVIDSYPTAYQKCQLICSLGWARQTTPFAPKVVDTILETTKELAYPYKEMYSGAGHDAQYIAEIVPSGMIFVPSQDGHSHCEVEYTSLEDCAQGVNVLLNSILALDKKN